MNVPAHTPTPRPHKIGTLDVDFEFRGPVDTVKDADDLAWQVRQELLPALEQAILQLGLDEIDLSLEYLEIDLGRFSDVPDWQELRQQLIDSFVSQVSQRIPTQINSAARFTSENTQMSPTHVENHPIDDHKYAARTLAQLAWLNGIKEPREKVSWLARLHDREPTSFKKIIVALAKDGPEHSAFVDGIDSAARSALLQLLDVKDDGQDILSAMHKWLELDRREIGQPPSSEGIEDPRKPKKEKTPKDTFDAKDVWTQIVSISSSEIAELVEKLSFSEVVELAFEAIFAPVSALASSKWTTLSQALTDALKKTNPAAKHKQTAGQVFTSNRLIGAQSNGDWSRNVDLAPQVLVEIARTWANDPVALSKSIAKRDVDALNVALARLKALASALSEIPRSPSNMVADNRESASIHQSSVEKESLPRPLDTQEQALTTFEKSQPSATKSADWGTDERAPSQFSEYEQAEKPNDESDEFGGTKGGLRGANLEPIISIDAKAQDGEQPANRQAISFNGAKKALLNAVFDHSKASAALKKQTSVSATSDKVQKQSASVRTLDTPKKHRISSLTAEALNRVLAEWRASPAAFDAFLESRSSADLRKFVEEIQDITLFGSRQNSVLSDGEGSTETLLRMLISDPLVCTLDDETVLNFVSELAAPRDAAKQSSRDHSPIDLAKIWRRAVDILRLQGREAPNLTANRATAVPFQSDRSRKRTATAQKQIADSKSAERLNEAAIKAQRKQISLASLSEQFSTMDDKSIRSSFEELRESLAAPKDDRPQTGTGPTGSEKTIALNEIRAFFEQAIARQDAQSVRDALAELQQNSGSSDRYETICRFFKRLLNLDAVSLDAAQILRFALVWSQDQAAFDKFATVLTNENQSGSVGFVDAAKDVELRESEQKDDNKTALEFQENSDGTTLENLDAISHFVQNPNPETILIERLKSLFRTEALPRQRTLSGDAQTEEGINLLSELQSKLPDIDGSPNPLFASIQQRLTRISAKFDFLNNVMKKIEAGAQVDLDVIENSLAPMGQDTSESNGSRATETVGEPENIDAVNRLSDGKLESETPHQETNQSKALEASQDLRREAATEDVEKAVTDEKATENRSMAQRSHDEGYSKQEGALSSGKAHETATSSTSADKKQDVKHHFSNVDAVADNTAAEMATSLKGASLGKSTLALGSDGDAGIVTGVEHRQKGAENTSLETSYTEAVKKTLERLVGPDGLKIEAPDLAEVLDDTSQPLNFVTIAGLVTIGSGQLASVLADPDLGIHRAARLTEAFTDQELLKLVGPLTPGLNLADFDVLKLLWSTLPERILVAPLKRVCFWQLVGLIADGGLGRWGGNAGLIERAVAWLARGVVAEKEIVKAALASDALADRTDNGALKAQVEAGLRNLVPASPTKLPEFEEKEGATMLTQSSGLVLLSPYLPLLFERMNLTDGQVFRSFEAMQEGMDALSYIVFANSVVPEAPRPMERLICGVASGVPVRPALPVSAENKELIDGLLQSVSQQWKPLKGTSIEGLRESFLLREGLIEDRGESLRLSVSPRPFDMLLDSLPWAYGVMKFAWMDRAIHVSWRNSDV